MEALKEKIIAESQRLGIDKIGFASAEPFTELRGPLEAQRAKGYNSGFEHPVVEERIDVTQKMPNAKSFIAIALAYPTQTSEKMPRDEKRGKFARVSWGVDYHTILQAKMAALIRFIRTQAASVAEAEHWDFVPQVDTGELVDVAVAARAGLGFVGRNGLLITEEFGSFVYLGEIVTNLPFSSDPPVPNGCGECTRCITKCPTQALLPSGGMNAKRCLSYQTQTKGFMPKEFRNKMSNVIYGCDICQLVCPYNRGKDVHFHPEMEPVIDDIYPQLQPLLSMSNRTFKEKFGYMSGGWRGKKPLQRNAIIALANLGDRSALPAISQCTKDARPVIRGTAAWAIGKLGKKEPENWRQFLKEMAKDEEDEAVRLEISDALLLLEQG